MSHRRIVFVLLVGLAGLTLMFAAGPQDDSNEQQREAGWSAVEGAITDGQPQTAIEHLDPLITAALGERRYAEATKAIGLKIALQGNIQGNKPEEKITRMRAEIENVPAEMKPVMEAIVANWFWQYLQQNRWRFQERTQTAAPPSDDFTTWDLPRILGEIDAQFTRVLKEADTLKGIPVTDYDDLLDKGSAPDAYRPTLYDVLAHNALEFYSSGEQVANRRQDAFDLTADGPLFGSVADFLAWQPDTTDQGSLKLKSVKLFQDLIRFHLSDEDPSALLDADLLRLNFGNNAAFGEEKAARYKAALRRFADTHASHEISTRAIHDLATAVYDEDDWIEAHRIATGGVQRFPESVGGRRCYNLIQQIESRAARVTAERVWNDPQPTIDVYYRNVTKVFFRLTEFNFNNYVNSNRWSPEQLDRDLQRALLARRPVKSWSVDLPETEDFHERVERLAAPLDVPAGSYFLIASHNADFSDVDNQVAFTEIWKSDLALVTRDHQGAGRIDGFVLNANSGSPIAGATVRLWQRDNQNRLRPQPSLRTDRDGRFEIRSTNGRQLLLLATHQGHSLSTYNHLSSYTNDPYRGRQESTSFFTDRALYRPGQSIHYKGICISSSQQNDRYRTIPRRDLTVVFLDVNGKEIERVQHRSNDYGSFSGSVTAPRDRLMGQMSIRVESGPHGAAQVTVEEYKRPKFQVAIAPPSKAAKLNEVVKLVGTASAYTGAAIDDAEVRWRVVRNVQYPNWWYWRCWWMPVRPGSSQEISHGTAKTSANGTFDIEFTAKPDLSVLEESEPTFRYTVHADVVDTTGETRSASQTISVGYTALTATLSVASWLTDDDPVDVAVRTTTLDGLGQTAQGSVVIHQLLQPEQVARASLSPGYYPRAAANEPPPSDPSNPNSWALGEAVHQADFETDAAGNATLGVNLDAGIYRAILQTTDRFGKAVTAEVPIQVVDPEANRLNLKIPNLFLAQTTTLEPGETFKAVWGSGYDQARAFVEVEHRGRLLQSFWTTAETTQVSIEQPVNEAMRGGFTVHTTMIRENRAYIHSQRVDVPWTNKNLKLSWERFVSKLDPAAKETFTAIVRGPDAEQAAAEMVAAMYDASLDAYLPHSWRSGFGVFRQDYSRVYSNFENQLKNLTVMVYQWDVSRRDGSLNYRRFPAQILQALSGYQFLNRRFQKGAMMMEAAAPAAMSDEMVAGGMAADATRSDLRSETGDSITLDEGEGGNPQDLDLSQVSARKNLNETAFFFPHLIAGTDGSVRIEFTMPEALTEWKFLGFAHDNELRAGLLTGSTVTAKELMVQPNPPRFVREGDEIEFTVKVSNQSPTHQSGTVRVTFADARTGTAVDDRLGNQDFDNAFDLSAGESTSLSWRLSVPDGLGFLTYKAVGSTGKLSDGEEGFLPVLSRRILVTESLPLPIRGKQTKRFEFARLLASGNSDSLEHQSLTLQMVSNPSWYAVLALPYLMEYPHQCTEQTFNRLYANSLAHHITSSDPKIERIFEQWRAAPALDSPMAQNEDLKSVLIEETPWYRQAQSESQARRNVGVLFDNNRLSSETNRALQQLAQMQLPDGAWPWFPGGRANDFITLYITTGFGRMRHLGVDIDTTLALKSLTRLDAWVTEMYEDIKDRDANHLSTTVALYLYGRSFFLRDQSIAPEHSEAVNYWLSQARKYWLDLAHRQSQAHLAIALNRFGDQASARGIMKSIKERSVSDEELGMFWRDLEFSWWWYRAPIETQAMMIEAFDEVMDDRQAVEDCKVWLLKQKQTQDWKTTKATADAVYALLLRGSDLLASDVLVEVALAGQTIAPQAVEAGTGFYEQRFVGTDVRPELGEVSVKKIDDGVAWGSLHWQYLEDISKITPHDGTPLKLTKQLYVKQNTGQGPMLEPVNGAVKVGDELVVRLVLRTDRDMEYVHLKDHRGSGTEPVNVLSRYQYQDGLAYYESTRDTASHFFIDYLPKGTYVFEYSTRVQLRGNYQTGIANIQCMYAPEFNSHSESLGISVE